VTHLKILEDAHVLTPLTSSTKPYKPTQEHRDVFEKVKEALISQPLFNNLVDEAAPKYLWVDASTGSGVIGAVLAQKKRGVPDEKIVPHALIWMTLHTELFMTKNFHMNQFKFMTSYLLSYPSQQQSKPSHQM
jgi:hypothetical protein